MPTVELDGRAIAAWPAFHDASRRAFGFPDFYGRNMSAWIDCLSTLRENDGMSAFVLGPDEILEILLQHADSLRRRAPRILAALSDAVEEVNQRHLDSGEKPVLALLLH
jgi:RNAse (barnase) inhibitor barstar